MITIITIYIIGFFLTLTFFKYFGVKIGFDYDNRKMQWDLWLIKNGNDPGYENIILIKEIKDFYYFK
jgi:hypothetical protein